MLSYVVPNWACTFTEDTILALQNQFHYGWAGYRGTNIWVCCHYTQDKEISEDMKRHTNRGKNHKTHKADIRNCIQTLKNGGTDVCNSLNGVSRTNRIIPSDMK